MVSTHLRSKNAIDAPFCCLKAVFLNSGDNAVPETIVRTDIKGRLLTPEEGCGQSKVPNNNRIVGGSSAKKGKNRQ